MEFLHLFCSFTSGNLSRELSFELLFSSCFAFEGKQRVPTFFFLGSFLAASAFMGWVGGSTLRPNGEGKVSSRCNFFTLGLPTLPFTSLVALPAVWSSRSWASTFWQVKDRITLVSKTLLTTILYRPRPKEWCLDEQNEKVNYDL